MCVAYGRQMYLVLCERMEACFYGHQNEHVPLRDVSCGCNASAAMWEYSEQIYAGTYVASPRFDPVEESIVLGHVRDLV